MAIRLPYQHTKDRQFNQYQQSMQAALAPITNLPTSTSSILTNIQLVSGVNNVPTKLNKKLSGWYIIRRRQFSVSGTPTSYDITDTYDTQASQNPPQDQTQILQLYCTQGTTTNPVIVDLIVF